MRRDGGFAKLGPLAIGAALTFGAGAGAGSLSRDAGPQASVMGASGRPEQGLHGRPFPEPGSVEAEPDDGGFERPGEPVAIAGGGPIGTKAAEPRPKLRSDAEAPTGGGDLEQDAYDDLSGLRSALGRETDAIRRDLVIPGLRRLAKRAAAYRQLAAAARGALECLAKDIRLDEQSTRDYDPPEARVSTELRLIARELDGTGDSLLPRLRRAEAGLAAGKCLSELAGSNLADAGERSFACHRALGGAFSSIALLQRESAAVWPVVEREWGRIAAGLKGIAENPRRPDAPRAAERLRFLQGRVQWHQSHTREAAWFLALVPLEKEVSSEELAARARLRARELHRAIGPFFEASKTRPVLAAWERARDARLELHLSAEAWSRPGPEPRHAEAEAGARALTAFLDALDSSRKLAALEDSVAVRP